jgi:RNA recognition motif-containing protein
MSNGLMSGGDNVSKTLYVGNLPWQTNESELTSAFEAHGQVISSRIVTEKETGRSRGFGFVEVEDADAGKIIKSMNGFNLNGRDLIVNEARPKSSSSEQPSA